MSAAPARGGDAVRAALVEAACDLLAEVGPRALSIRNVAERAGVNHGQIHHYFGGKGGLLRAAMTRLAAEHWQNSLDRAKGGPVPPALSVGEDARYWQATCRAVMEGDLELAGVEVEEGLSVPRRAFAALREAGGISARDPEARAGFAFLVAAQLGWVAFEEFATLQADVPESERAATRERVTRLIERMTEELFETRR